MIISWCLMPDGPGWTHCSSRNLTNDCIDFIRPAGAGRKMIFTCEDTCVLYLLLDLEYLGDKVDIVRCFIDRFLLEIRLSGVD